jgi:hypothetical protein
MQPDSAARRLAIQAALLDFQKTPGKHALMQRQPALLFSSIREVLQLASGRTPGNLGEDASDAVRQAAAFFVRSALLGPSSDHYALLGLARTADAAAIKDRYRLMMRLLHPDFAVPGSTSSWPADTAARVNQAYEVLSSASKRKAYDESLEKDRAVKPPNPAPRSTAVAVKAAARPPAEDPRKRLKTLSIVFGSLATLALIAILMAGGDRESLVQRAVPVATAIQPAPVAAVRIEAAPVATAPATPEPVALVAKPEAIEPLRSNGAAAPAPSAPVFIAAPTPAPPSQLPVPAAPAPVLPTVTTQAVSPPATVVVAPAPPPPVVVAAAAPTAPQFKPGLTMADVHPLLSRLLQQVESGSGDRLAAMLDRDARNAPATQALVRQYNSLVDGSNTIKVSQVHFKAQPLDGRLLVTGTMLVEVAGAAPAPAREFSLQAEFVSRDGSVQMSRLVRASGAAMSEGTR